MNGQPKYGPGDIVLVTTSDALTGKITCPGVVREVVDHENGSWHYEVNVYADNGSSPADQDNIRWWPLSEDEIASRLGHVLIQHPIEKKKGTNTFTITRF